MSNFSFRDRPNLRDRLRGKSGDEIMEELRQSLDQDRQNFFENSRWSRPPPARTFSRGFPFNDDIMPGKSKLKECLEDLAQRHPEIADQLKGFTEIDGDIPRQTSRERLFQDGSRFGKSNSFDKDTPPRSTAAAQPDSKVTTSDETKSNDVAEQGPSKVNFRSTVPDMQSSQVQQDQQRSNRSQSAPPEASQLPNQHQQFMGGSGSKGPQHGPIEIPIQMDLDSHTPNQPNFQHNSEESQPRPQPQAQSHPGQPQTHGRTQERYIPIFVEGRGETIVNVPSEKSQTSQVPPQQPPPQPQPQQHHYKPTAQSPPPQSAPAPSEVEPPVAQQTAPPQQQQQQPQVAPQPQPPPRPPSPLTLVAGVQKEVEELKQRVEAFKGTSKSDKEYIYLDEMLTRNLLKLDNIETEGKDEVRAARKEVIKLIQECINKLESSVPNQNTT